MASFQVTLPAGIQAGQEMQAPIPQGYPNAGQMQRFIIPQGVGPGQVIAVPLPQLAPPVATAIPASAPPPPSAPAYQPASSYTPAPAYAPAAPAAPAVTQPMVNVAELQEMLATVSSVNQRCAAAQRHYRRAMQWENQAQRDNRRAKRDAYWDGGGMFEQMDQANRSRDMNAALQHAMTGSQELQMAFSMVPPGCLLRQRYPGLMATVGTVPVPVLSGGNFGAALSADFFGGGWGAMSNDFRSGDQIRRNKVVIRRCEQICGEQQMLLAAVTRQIQMDMGMAGAGYSTAPAPIYSAAPAAVISAAPAPVVVGGGGRGGGGGMGLFAAAMGGMMVGEAIAGSGRRHHHHGRRHHRHGRW